MGPWWTIPYRRDTSRLLPFWGINRPQDSVDVRFPLGHLARPLNWHLIWPIFPGHKSKVGVSDGDPQDPHFRKICSYNRRIIWVRKDLWRLPSPALWCLTWRVEQSYVNAKGKLLGQVCGNKSCWCASLFVSEFVKKGQNWKRASTVCCFSDPSWHLHLQESLLTMTMTLLLSYRYVFCM